VWSCPKDPVGTYIVTARATLGNEVAPVVQEDFVVVP
jgi:hypothetical protein